MDTISIVLITILSIIGIGSLVSFFKRSIKMDDYLYIEWLIIGMVLMFIYLIFILNAYVWYREGYFKREKIFQEEPIVFTVNQEDWQRHGWALSAEGWENMREKHERLHCEHCDKCGQVLKDN